jgi:NAD(P)-dependent dehydrogenase (short-subunit alcohol dehydrogenase family)
MHERIRSMVPIGRAADPADIAAAVSFLAGPGASAFTGQILQPNGGTTRTRA